MFGVEGLPEVRPGDDLAALITDALRRSDLGLQDRDVLVVSQKVVSKAEGRVVRAVDVRPSARARALAEGTPKSPAHVEVILRETARIVRTDRERGIFIVETPQGLVCANAGVDRSNVGAEEVYTTLPEDPDASAATLRDRLEEAFGVRLAVVIADTFGRPWRLGQVEFAIGVSGLRPLQDLRGVRDPFGYVLQGTVLGMVDEVAAAAGLVKGKVDGIPVAVVRGAPVELGEGRFRELVRDPSEDLFR